MGLHTVLVEYDFIKWYLHLVSFIIHNSTQSFCQENTNSIFIIHEGIILLQMHKKRDRNTFSVFHI
jgi:hypothetical protein